jgi:ring-1,2-phenylacetyl-CoA epoxidase subunit PaaD
MVTAAIDKAQVHEWLAEVLDPEVPALSIVDLGIVRDVEVSADEVVTVTLTPTYSGCPATEVIETCVTDALRSRGVGHVSIKRVLSPPWTTDWITLEGREKLRRYGIAPPSPSLTIACPQCESLNTERVSEFGSTACKASWRCCECLEPFEYFKCL